MQGIVQNKPLWAVQRMLLAVLNSGNDLAQVSAGGLVSALMGVSNFKTMWVGWPGKPPPHPSNSLQYKLRCRSGMQLPKRQNFACSVCA